MCPPPPYVKVFVSQSRKNRVYVSSSTQAKDAKESPSQLFSSKVPVNFFHHSTAIPNVLPHTSRRAHHESTSDGGGEAGWPHPLRPHPGLFPPRQLLPCAIAVNPHTEPHATRSAVSLPFRARGGPGGKAHTWPTAAPVGAPSGVRAAEKIL